MASMFSLANPKRFMDMSEKLLPWRRAATWGTAAVLFALGVLLLVAPEAIPGLTIPGGSMDPMMP